MNCTLKLCYNYVVYAFFKTRENISNSTNEKKRGRMWHHLFIFLELVRVTNRKTRLTQMQVNLLSVIFQ